jgi:hypothetical protein
MTTKDEHIELLKRRLQLLRANGEPAIYDEQTQTLTIGRISAVAGDTQSIQRMEEWIRLRVRAS